MEENEMNQLRTNNLNLLLPKLTIFQITAGHLYNLLESHPRLNMFISR